MIEYWDPIDQVVVAFWVITLLAVLIVELRQN